MRSRLCLVVLFLLTAPLRAATYTVTNTTDAGPGSLRQAILDANANPVADTIAFAVPGSDPNCNAGGVCSIAPLSDLPQITDATTIDGYTQPGASVNTLAQGTNAVIKIYLTGSLDGDPDSVGIFLDGDNSQVRGLAIGFFDHGVRAYFHSDIKVAGCFIGLDPSGVTMAPNQWGISGLNAPNVAIGGIDPADRNIISANSTAGVDLYGCPGGTIPGNLIGTDATGIAGLGNGTGISASSPGAANLTIGGPAPGAGDVISGNMQNGVTLSLGPGSVALVQGNLVGTDASGSLSVGNTFTGIRILTSGAIIGGIGAGEGNVIANNGSSGIGVESAATGITIRGNSIYGNGNGAFGYQIGIDLEPSGLTANDLEDGDSGANGLQNFPIISSADPLPGGGTRIQGVLHSALSSDYDLDFYSNGACLPHTYDFLQGRTYLGSAHVTTDANGTAPFDVTLPPTILAGEYVSATATDAQGSTSEFSQRLVFFVSPNSGPAAGGTPVNIGGTDFLPGLTLTAGGVPLTGIGAKTFTFLTATTPVLSPGTLNDIVLTDPDGASGTLEGGFVADFLDVPSSHPFYSFVTSLVLNKITAGVGGGNYGVDAPTLRQQMAVFLLKTKYGLCYTPPPCTTPIFTDVPCSSNFAPWINELAAEGITGGCGGGTTYCPTSPVLRQQMAALLLRAFEGAAYTPPPCVTATFADVPCSSIFAPWIYELVARHVTAGCGDGTNYCPLADTTRGQMAVFLNLTF